MLTLTPTTAAAIAIVCGAWLAVALWATLRGLSLARKARRQLRESARASALLGSQIGVSAVVTRDGALDADGRLAGLLAIEREPVRLDDLGNGETGLTDEDKARLSDAVGRAASAAGSFTLAVRA